MAIDFLDLNEFFYGHSNVIFWIWMNKDGVYSHENSSMADYGSLQQL